MSKSNFLVYSCMTDLKTARIKQAKTFFSFNPAHSQYSNKVLSIEYLLFLTMVANKRHITQEAPKPNPSMVSLYVYGTLSIPKATSLLEDNVKVDRGVNICYFCPPSDEWGYTVKDSGTFL
jgi:hypothetical protein